MHLIQTGLKFYGSTKVCFIHNLLVMIMSCISYNAIEHALKFSKHSENSHLLIIMKNGQQCNKNVVVLILKKKSLQNFRETLHKIFFKLTSKIFNSLSKKLE
jgi:hypothetical protein